MAGILDPLPMSRCSWSGRSGRFPRREPERCGRWWQGRDVPRPVLVGKSAKSDRALPSVCFRSTLSRGRRGIAHVSFGPRDPPVRGHLERGHAVREPVLVPSQVGAADWTVHEQLINGRFCRYSEHSDALGHAREQMVCFFNGPNIRPTMLLDEQGSQRVR